MYFEMVLEMALACGAVYDSCGRYYISADSVSVDFSQFDADVLGAISAELGFDVMLCHSYDDILSDLIQVEGSDFDQWELGFSGIVGGQEYDFLVDCAD
jgi:hypothetical protein